MNSDTLGVSVGATHIEVDTHANATLAISTINVAIEAVSTERSKYGAVQNRLEHTTSLSRISIWNFLRHYLGF